MYPVAAATLPASVPGAFLVPEVHEGAGPLVCEGPSVGASSTSTPSLWERSLSAARVLDWRVPERSILARSSAEIIFGSRAQGPVQDEHLSPAVLLPCLFSLRLFYLPYSFPCATYAAAGKQHPNALFLEALPSLEEENLQLHLLARGPLGPPWATLGLC